MQKVLYTDACHPTVEDKIRKELGLSIVPRMPDEQWNIQDSAKIITDPNITLAVFNQIDEISLMEIGVLLFLCRPILVTAKAASEYKTLIQTVDFVEPNCNLKEPGSAFISWYRFIKWSEHDKTS